MIFSGLYSRESRLRVVRVERELQELIRINLALWQR